MNYRHAFHAGNFADVVKHAVLARIVTHLLKKESAFRVIDTHGGAGLYDLKSDEAQRGAEWHDGIGKLWRAKPDPAIADLLQPYIAAIRGFNTGGTLTSYPGSPLLVRAWLRPQDRLIACEVEPKAGAALARLLNNDERTKAITIDGWTALTAYIPPKERRGVVLIDPPFEEKNEFDRLAEALKAAHRKWPTGIFLAWYPIKDTRESKIFARKVSLAIMAEILRAEVTLTDVDISGKLRGTGLILINPPWTLEAEIRLLLPALAKILAGTGRESARVERISGPAR